MQCTPDPVLESHQRGAPVNVNDVDLVTKRDQFHLATGGNSSHCRSLSEEVGGMGKVGVVEENALVCAATKNNNTTYIPRKSRHENCTRCQFVRTSSEVKLYLKPFYLLRQYEPLNWSPSFLAVVLGVVQTGVLFRALIRRQLTTIYGTIVHYP
jgi:hypothetical protein